MRSALLVVLAVAGCVFPSSEPTGVEFSWRFFEANLVDGEDRAAVRSCAGASVETVEVDITDDDSPRRQGVFRFPCDFGYQTLTEFQTEASDAFVELDPGAYTMRVFAVDPETDSAAGELLEERTIDVADRRITTAPWELSRATVDWSLQLSGATECTELTLSLVYEDAAVQLPELVLEDDEAGTAVLYREELVSDDDVLRFDGVAVACGEALEAIHTVPAIDRGTYLLEIGLDGTTCAVRVEIDPTQASLPLDLANLPCAG